ncbi:MAG: hypothetical protein WCO51_09010 [bacterium]|jgi:hypothetical protein
MSCVLAIDPGTSKCGLALVAVAESGKLVLLWRGVCPLVKLTEYVTEALELFPPDQVVVGGGTGAAKVLPIVANIVKPIVPKVIDETDTTLLARTRYWNHTPRRGWRRFVPLSLQVPPEPYDDFVAIILAERTLLNLPD